MTDPTIELTCIEQIKAIDEDSFFFWGDGSEQYILKDGIIRQKAYQQILSSKSFAEEYLNLIRTDRIGLDNQTQHLVILDKLDDLIKGSRWDFRDLAALFRDAMLALAQNASQKLSEIQSREEIEDAVQMGFQYYEYNGLVDSVVRHARRAAVMGMIRKFAEQYSAEGGCKGDLHGRYHFELSKPRIDGVVPWLARDYKAEGKLLARIHQQREGAWLLHFPNLIPFNDMNRLGLTIEAGWAKMGKNGRRPGLASG